MAGFLTAAQRTAFAGPVIDGTKFRRLLELSDGVTTYDISARVFDPGQTIESVKGTSPKDGFSLKYPGVAWGCRNDDAYLTPGAASGLWPDRNISGWTMRLRLYESLSTGSEVLLYDETFTLLPPELRLRECTLIGISPLAAYWGKGWDREADRYAVDWNGYPHDVTF